MDHSGWAVRAAAFVLLAALCGCGGSKQGGEAGGAAAGAANVAPAVKADGLWDAVVTVGGADIPFRFEIDTSGTNAQGFFFEGDKKVGSSSGTYTGAANSSLGNLKLEYDFLNATLDATIEPTSSGDQLSGTFGDHYAGDAPMAIRAHRFMPASADAGTAPQVAGNWEMRRVPAEATRPSDSRTWNLYLRQSGAEVTGSILRVDGDTGTLSGEWSNGTLTLSHFAGERPYLFEATQNKDGTLAVELNRGAHYVAVKSTQARAKGIPEPPDPTRYTSVKDPTTPFAFSFPDMRGKTMANTDAEFRGKVVLLAIGGTWCPNCNDEAPFLVQLYQKFHAQGLEIVGLMFEADSDPAQAVPHMQTFAKRYGVQYPLLLAGTPDDLAMKLPQLVNFGAYPTTIYLGRDGRVRSVHAGFASAATGAEHDRLESEVTMLIERLLAEDSSGASAAKAGE